MQNNDEGSLSDEWEVKARAFVVGLAFVVMASAIMVFHLPAAQVTLNKGDVSPRDIRAPFRKTYVSQVLTEEERAKAERAVEDIYDPPDAKVAHQQIAKASQVCDYIDSVRNDIYATAEQKKNWLEAIPDLELTSEATSSLLRLSETEWQEVAEQTIYVLDRVMRRVIQENQLLEAKRTSSAFISPELSETQAEIVLQLARSFIRPNSFYNPEKTSEAKRKARESVPQMTQTIEKGEIILRVGEVVTDLDLEALDQFGLRQTKIRWQDLAGILVFVITIAFVMELYLLRFEREIFHSWLRLGLLAGTILFFILIAKLMVPPDEIWPYLFPLSTLSMVIAILFDPRLAVIATLMLSSVVGVLSEGSLELVAYSLFGGVIASLRLGRLERLNVLLWSAVHVILANLAVVLIFHLPEQGYDPVSLMTLMGLSIVNGGISASLTMVGLFVISSTLGIHTSLQLLELARPDHPLLHQLLLKAPGTYHHSLLISNMAEQAAERIGADDLLARIGAYYHDIGKTLRPYFFIENQADGVNVHDRLDPRTSAQLIVSHVKDGLALAKKYNVPPRIRDFISEHHGTGLVKYFYRQACQASQAPELLDEAAFRYPGPKPRTKETAILMLADSCEAAVRSANLTSLEEIDHIVQEIINEKLSEGELDDSDLTLRDLREIRSAFVNVLQGIFHPRVKYPEEVRAPAPGFEHPVKARWKPTEVGWRMENGE